MSRAIHVLVFVLLATGAAAQQPERFAPPPRPSELQPRPPLKDALPLDAPTTWTCQQWRFLDSKTFGSTRGWGGWRVGSPQLVEYGYQLTELQRLGGRFVDLTIAPDVRSGLQLLVDGTLSHDVDMWTLGERRLWRACGEYERDAVRRDEVDRIMRRGSYACVGCLYWNSAR
jgi:hypothetical protein